MLMMAAFWCGAATTINNANRYAYGANIGWMDWRGDVANGVVIGEYDCSGSIYAANIGWISLGNGSPPGGIYYSNTSATDWGVNHDGLGNLRGYAYGANIGWVNFETNGAARVDLATGNFSGYAYSANCGWISLSNAFAFVQTGNILAGADGDGDGIADAWELIYTNTLVAFNATSDSDGDGMTDRQEYVAGTNPLDANDVLSIAAITWTNSSPPYVQLSWSGKPHRFYGVQGRNTLDAGDSWGEFYTAASPGVTGIGFNQTTNQQFYRLRVFRPLTP